VDTLEVSRQLRHIADELDQARGSLCACIEDQRTSKQEGTMVKKTKTKKTTAKKTPKRLPPGAPGHRTPEKVSPPKTKRVKTAPK
jgi:hypothetical protein